MKKGFTLIELLVSITILLILIASALGSFVDFADRRSVSNAVDELKGSFISLKTKAHSGSLSGCTELASYRLQTVTVADDSQVITQAVCVSGTAETAKIVELENVTISPALDINFNTLGKGVDLDGGAATETIIVTDTSGSNIYEFDLSRDGQVTEGAWQ